ncbi:MAG: hypothetical protein M1834_004570 [Cirrosporium novae-zelandiae]|nr:MAG: hypothetical protein M1834_004570 [Cirrosporium novae-zelandiae]
MSSSITPPKYDFLVILPDYPGVLEKRMSVREEHLSGTKPNVDGGFLTFGGAMLDEVPKEGTSLKINGSAMLVSATSKEDALEQISKDIYYREGIWDKEKIKIVPFKTAVRQPLKL